MENITLVNDWLTTYGGSEAVVSAFMEIWPKAPIYTLVYDDNGECQEMVKGKEVHTSFLQKFPGAAKRYRTYLPFMPLAIEQFDLGNYDVVLSSYHAVAKGVLTTADQLHITYVHTPIRYAWNLYFQYLDQGFSGGLKETLAKTILHYIRVWDVITANRVDVFLANSQNVANRIWRTYRREAQIVFPPVDVDRFEPASQREDFYVTVSRLVPYKRVDLIVDAFTKMGLPLIVLGDGSEMEKMQSRAGENVIFLGRQPDSVVSDYLNRAKAFVFAAEEDFGITPVEGQAAGCPVIAYGKGGALETVIEGETGLFFREQSVDSLVAAVKDFEDSSAKFDIDKLRYNAERFSKDRFLTQMEEIVSREYKRFRGGESLPK